MILIVGCGYLGSYLQKEFSEKSDETILATVRNLSDVKNKDLSEYVYCDITDEDSLKNLAVLCEDKELIVFYFAACHNVDYVFDNPSKARKINVSALENFFETVPNIKKFFYASTDCVYGEGKNPDILFNESSPLTPINEYGIQKAEAESIVLKKGFTVLRLPFMIGPSLGKKPHFYDNITSSLLKGEKVEMIDGMHRSVLSYKQVAEIMVKLSFLPYDSLPEIINICGDNSMTKYEIGCAIAKKIGISCNNITKISEDDSRKFFRDKRASYAVMDNKLLKNLIGLKEIKWEV